MNIDITITIQHSVSRPTLRALKALIRSALPLFEAGARPENGHVVYEETPEHIRDIRHAPQMKNKACSVCGNPIAASSKTGHCTACAMKQARAARPRWRKENRGESVPAQPVPTACGECGGKIGKTNKTGYCIRCNMKHNRINPTGRLPAAFRLAQAGGISGSGLQDIVREPSPVDLSAVPSTAQAGVAPMSILPFCVHDRDPDTCIHCAQMRAAGMDTTRPARDRKEDMNPKKN
ncbi:MAG: hypothetical protein UY96_C0039G0006 [Parcubacteria group bacterium GW2011_GWB1_56_8]|nr:MAG: hypothetical protein UY96_C0039G0006 [Parcubacteria group bacterium GW2011_GWB1_56_8]